MSEHLSRAQSSLICGTTFVVAIILLTSLPIVGPLFSAAAFFGSPISWIVVPSWVYYVSSYSSQAPPGHLKAIFDCLRYPGSFFVHLAGPFLVYGLVLGFKFPLESESDARTVKSLAMRFILTVLAVSIVGRFLALYAVAHDS